MAKVKAKAALRLPSEAEIERTFAAASKLLRRVIVDDGWQHRALGKQSPTPLER